MGKRGPKPKPTALKILEGNPSRRALPEFEPTNSLPPEKPSAVIADELASTEWDRLLAAMPPGIYSALDSSALASYALAWSLLVKSQNEIDQNGIMITIYEKAEDGTEVIRDIKRNPAIAVWRAASQTLIQMTDRLGLSPGTRTKLQVPQRDAQPQSKFAGLMGRPVE